MQAWVTVTWNQWKYPLTLSVFFLLIYVCVDILDPAPSVNLPDDIRLLLNDRRRLQLPRPRAISADVPAIAEHHIQAAVIAAEQWYPAENTDDVNEDSKRRWLDSRNEQQMHNRLNAAQKGRIKDKAVDHSFHEEERDILGGEIERRLMQREIIGNERFVNRFQNGIQKPEDFRERNRDAAVKIRTAPVTKVQLISGADDRNASKPNRIERSTTSLLHVRTTPSSSVTEENSRTKSYTAVRNRTSSKWNKPSNFTAVPKLSGTHRPVDKANSLGIYQMNNKTELSDASRMSRHNDVQYAASSRFGRTSHRRRKRRLNGTTLADLESGAYPPVVVKATGAFLDRIRAYNAAIAAASAEILQRRGYGPWRDVADPEHLNVVWGNTDDFLERLVEQPRVKTVLLAWFDSTKSGSAWSSLQDPSNVLVNQYYQWSATLPLCAWIRTPGFTKARWDAVYDRECNEEMSLAARPQSLEFMYFYAKPINVNHYWPNYGTAYPAYFYTRPPPHVFYVSLLQDAVVNAVGDVISGDLKLVPYTCSHDNLPTLPAEYGERPVYRELFVMTQFWGQSFFHKIVEVMPRVAPYVDFLRANPGIEIHAPEDRSQVSQMLQMLGIDPVRVVTGVTRAKLVYLPQGTPCGFPDARGIQLLSRLLRQHVRSTAATTHGGGGPPRNRLIYVRRSGLRKFAVEAPIEFVLRAVAERRRLNFTVFSDRPSPPLSVAAELFNAAVLVVGPHGAGLSNVVFCEPGTALIEGVCNEPHVNMCYQMTAHMLGLRYHAVPSRGGCERVVDVTASDVENAVETYVDMVLADMNR